MHKCFVCPAFNTGTSAFRAAPNYKSSGFYWSKRSFGEKKEAIPCVVFSFIPPQQECIDIPAPSFITRVRFKNLIHKEQSLSEYFLHEILQTHKM